MSTRKAASDAAHDPEDAKLASNKNSTPATRPALPVVEASSLRIDEDFDPGGDPYNQTGQYCVVDLKLED